MPKYVVPPITQTWLDANYYHDGCNLRTASARLGVQKATLWAWMRANGYAVKPQSESQSGAMNGFYSRRHGAETRKKIGAASARRQPKMARGKFGRYGDDGKHPVGPNNPTWKTGIGTYRKLVEVKSCFICGGIDGLQVHHIDRNRVNNAPANLVVLCPRCHTFKAHGRIKDTKTGRFVKGGAR